MYKNILIPTDGSPLSRKAAQEAIEFARGQGAKVVALYVAPAYQPKVYADFVPADFVTPREYAATVRKTSARHLDFIKKLADKAGVPCACLHAMSDFPYVEIIKAAQRQRCDLIFMASHGRRGLSRLLLGSETSKVLSHSKIPVLVHR
ncbi:MAG: universal stress protein [Betaproteobacteria bacterium]|nr:universal stress protein [Betaproteobacteria bacterium]